jgi:hypothetical protein
MAKQTKENVKKYGVPTEQVDIGHPPVDSMPINNAELSPANPKGIKVIPDPGIVSPHG